MITPSSQRVFLSEVAVGLIVIALGFWAIVLWRGRVTWAEALGPITYLIHVMIFYGSWLMSKPPPNEFYSLWSVTLRLHAILWFTAFPIALYHRRRAR